MSRVNKSPMKMLLFCAARNLALQRMHKMTGKDCGHHDMIPGLAWMHTHLEGRGGHGTHGGFRERSERYQRHTLGGG